MMELHDIIMMNGYGYYVWTAYGFTSLVFLGNLYYSRQLIHQNLIKVRQR